MEGVILAKIHIFVETKTGLPLTGFKVKIKENHWFGSSNAVLTTDANGHAQYTPKDTVWTDGTYEIRTQLGYKGTKGTWRIDSWYGSETYRVALHSFNEDGLEPPEGEKPSWFEENKDTLMLVLYTVIIVTVLAFIAWVLGWQFPLLEKTGLDIGRVQLW